MKTLAKPRRKAAPRGKRPAVRKPGKAAKPDMTAFAARCLAFMREQYGNRVVPDSSPMLEELRADRF